MSIFVESTEYEHDEYGTFAFSEPRQRDVLRIPKIYGQSLEELQEMADDNDDDSVELDVTMDQVNMDELTDLLADLITDWPSDDEINSHNVANLKIDVLSWCMENAFDVIQQSQVTEDEEKN